MNVDERAIVFTTTDNVRLAGTWFVPTGATPPPSNVIVVVCGAGIPARFYGRLAHYLASKGAAVLTFDYRGIGGSRHGSPRKIRGGMDDWSLRDLGAALELAATQYPHAQMSAVAHSVGTLLLGAAAGADRLSRAVFLGAHTGFWRDYHARWRLPLFLIWHVLMPAITRVLGYFPGRMLRLGEDLPPQVALDWAARRQPELIRTRKDESRFASSLLRYREFRAATLALSISDDAFAPPPAAETLLAIYPNIVAVRQTVTPTEVGCRRLGHFGFVRRSTADYFWPRIAAWLMGEHEAELPSGKLAASA